MLRHLKVFASMFDQTALFLLIVFHCAVSGLTVKFLLTLLVDRFFNYSTWEVNALFVSI